MKLPLDWGQNDWVQTCLFDDESLMSGIGPSPNKNVIVIFLDFRGW